jgi:hypothetical protein
MCTPLLLQVLQKRVHQHLPTIIQGNTSAITNNAHKFEASSSIDFVIWVGSTGLSEQQLWGDLAQSMSKLGCLVARGCAGRTHCFNDAMTEKDTNLLLDPP